MTSLAHRRVLLQTSYYPLFKARRVPTVGVQHS